MVPDVDDLARWQRPGRVVDVGHPAFIQGQGGADGAEPVLGVEGVARAETCQLGHAPELQQRCVEPLLHLLSLGDRDGLATDGQTVDAG